MFKRIEIVLTVVFILTVLFSPTYVYSQHGEDQHEETVREENFNPGEMIMGHVGDEYGWHIMTIGETHITIPLPIIVFSEHSGFSIFMSSKFHHGHSSYKGFLIAGGENNPNKGKVVELVGKEEIRPYDISITKNTLSLFISIFLILWIFLSIAKSYRRREGQAPKGLQSLLEPLILFIRDDIAKASLGEKRYMKFTPFLLSIFFFIFLNNLLGLVPFFSGWCKFKRQYCNYHGFSNVYFRNYNDQR